MDVSRQEGQRIEGNHHIGRSGPIGCRPTTHQHDGSNTRSRIENLFISYHSLLRRNGPSWLIKDSQKVALYHVCRLSVLFLFTPGFSRILNFRIITSRRILNLSCNTPSSCRRHFSLSTMADRNPLKSLLAPSKAAEVTRAAPPTLRSHRRIFCRSQQKFAHLPLWPS